jgi:hypothetical protein
MHPRTCATHFRHSDIRLRHSKLPFGLRTSVSEFLREYVLSSKNAASELDLKKLENLEVGHQDSAISPSRSRRTFICSDSGPARRLSTALPHALTSTIARSSPSIPPFALLNFVVQSHIHENIFRQSKVSSLPEWHSFLCLPSRFNSWS